jgi:hypothetical protein
VTTAGYVAQYTGVALMGAGVGVGELVSRYKDRPWSAISGAPGLLYILINAAASAGALGLILTYGWKFGATGDAVVPTRLLLAGFGAMALFRSSLFTVRVGNSDVGVGPSTFLSLTLAACDRGVDRDRAQERAKMAKSLMTNVSYEKADDALPAVALGLMQNLDAADQAALSVQLEKIRQDKDISNQAKALLLGLALATVVGPEVLAQAKQTLGKDILLQDGEHAPADADEPSSMSGMDAQERQRPRGLPGTPQTPSSPEGP